MNLLAACEHVGLLQCRESAGVGPRTRANLNEIGGRDVGQCLTLTNNRTPSNSATCAFFRAAIFLFLSMQRKTGEHCFSLSLLWKRPHGHCKLAGDERYKSDYEIRCSHWGSRFPCGQSTLCAGRAALGVCGRGNAGRAKRGSGFVSFMGGYGAVLERRRLGAVCQAHQ